MSVQVALIRPGATLYDEQNRLQGNLDIPLSTRGESEASRLAERLAPAGMTALYCGPGESVVRTADVVGQLLCLRPRCLPELRNLDQGLWQGLQLDEIRRRNPKLYRRWLEDPLTICAPQGETVADAMLRVKTALKPIWKRHKHQLVGLVVGEPLAQLLCAYLRGLDRLQIDEDFRTGWYDRIDVASSVECNGQAPRPSRDAEG